jgi:signal transduction histidine kinase
MNRIFKKLPLAGKLILIGLVPLLFVIYLTYQVYNEKSLKLQVLKNYVAAIHQSADLSFLINALQTERKVSFDFALKKAEHNVLRTTRHATDSLLKKIESSNNKNVHGFKEYTNLNRLSETRSQIDSGKADANAVMHYFSNSIFRLNTLTSIPRSAYLESVYEDMLAQKLLSEMITYLGIIRSNIYNVLITRKYMVETLIGSTGAFDIYKSYEKELLIKSSPAVVDKYKSISGSSDLKTTRRYLDTLFEHYSFDGSKLTADQWWSISDNGLNTLSNLQQSLWQNVENKVLSIYNKEKNNRDRTLILFSVILIVLAALITYTIAIITNMLRRLKIAAQKISRGWVDVDLRSESNDVIGNLTRSIAEMAKTHQELSLAANEIGSGNFNVKVKPRSEKDVLGNAIKRMKDALRQYSEKMESLVKLRTVELERSNDDLQQFAHVISHDLKEPVRKIATFSSRITEEFGDSLPEKMKFYLSKIESAANRMYSMIDGVLLYSSINPVESTAEKIDLNEVVRNIESDLEILIQQKKAVVRYQDLPTIDGSAILIYQLFYNLISNSLKFSKANEPPFISISAERVQKEPANGVQDHSTDHMQITVKDNGIGFNPSHAKAIFRTFSRLNAKDKYEGTGLGLALCKKIVERHGGTIEADGKEGAGASFLITLPELNGSRSNTHL